MMIEWQGIWLPDGDTHFIDWMTSSGHTRDGRPTYQYQKYELALSLCQQRRTAIDIGAHVGPWTRVMALDFEFVQAFEPMAEFGECWRKNMAGSDNADLQAVALGNEKMTVSIVREAGNLGMSHVGENGLPAEMARLDDFDLQDVDFIKIDCEGYELFVLEGGAETLKRCRPVVCVEQKPGHGARYGLADTAAVDYLESLGASLHGEYLGDYFLSWQGSEDG